jgi:hypothetical protein
MSSRFCVRIANQMRLDRVETFFGVIFFWPDKSLNSFVLIRSFNSWLSRDSIPGVHCVGIFRPQNQMLWTVYWSLVLVVQRFQLWPPLGPPLPLAEGELYYSPLSKKWPLINHNWMILLKFVFLPIDWKPLRYNGQIQRLISTSLSRRGL